MIGVSRYGDDPGEAGAWGDIGNPPAWWAMWLLILTEAALFASLLLAYFYERSNASAWPPPGVDKPGLLLPLIMTALLVGSSVAMIVAERGIKRGSDVTLRIGLLVAVLLAGAFLMLQVIEYREKPFALDDSVYSAAFYTITGLHGLHVAIAALMGIVLVVRAMLGHFSSRRHTAVSVVSLYWHFVDVVWLFILSALYISPHVL